MCIGKAGGQAERLFKALDCVREVVHFEEHRSQELMTFGVVGKFGHCETKLVRGRLKVSFLTQDESERTVGKGVFRIEPGLVLSMLNVI